MSFISSLGLRPIRAVRREEISGSSPAKRHLSYLSQDSLQNKKPDTWSGFVILAWAKIICSSHTLLLQIQNAFL